MLPLNEYFELFTVDKGNFAIETYYPPDPPLREMFHTKQLCEDAEPHRADLREEIDAAMKADAAKVQN